jgi:hypothetical protein
MEQARPLYKGNKDVVQLSEKNFYQKANGEIQLKDRKKFQGPGVIKVYADWCPHCRDKEECMIELAKAFKASNMGQEVYVINCPTSTPFTEAIQLQGYPTFYKCNKEGILTLLKNNGSDVRTIPDIVNAVCKECRTGGKDSSAFQSKCFKK